MTGEINEKEVMLKYYIYFHIRLDTDTVFYVGKGCGRRANSKRNRNDYWHNIVNTANYKSKIVLQGLTESEALDKEKELIHLLKTVGQAEANLMLSGNSSFPQGYRPWNKGKSLTKEIKDKISNTLKGNIPWNKGKKLSKEHVDNLSKSHKGLAGNHVRKVIDTATGTVYNSVKDASETIGMKRKTLSAMLSGQNPNKTTLKYYN